MSELKLERPLQVRDVMQFLEELVKEHGADAMYWQFGKYDYDDWSLGKAGFTFACHEVRVSDLPKDTAEEGVDDELTSPKIVQLS